MAQYLVPPLFERAKWYTQMSYCCIIHPLVKFCMDEVVRRAYCDCRRARWATGVKLVKFFHFAYAVCAATSLRAMVNLIGSPYQVRRA